MLWIWMHDLAVLEDKNTTVDTALLKYTSKLKDMVVLAYLMISIERYKCVVRYEHDLE